MVRALAVLTCGAFLTLLIGVIGAGKPVLTVVLGGLYTVLATIRGSRGSTVATGGPGRWPTSRRCSCWPPWCSRSTPAPGRRCSWSCWSARVPVLLLPLPYTVVVILLVPMVHVGMSWWDGLREGFGTLAAVVFAAVVTELLRREQETRRALATAHEQLRDYALQAERLATAQSATGWPATSTTGWGTRSPSSRCRSRRPARCCRPLSATPDPGFGQGAAAGQRDRARRGAPLGTARCGNRASTRRCRRRLKATRRREASDGGRSRPRPRGARHR